MIKAANAIKDAWEAAQSGYDYLHRQGWSDLEIGMATATGLAAGAYLYSQYLEGNLPYSDEFRDLMRAANDLRTFDTPWGDVQVGGSYDSETQGGRVTFELLP
jgi:hypothetical protein